MKIFDQYPVIPILSDGDLNADVNLDSDSIYMRNAHRIGLIVNCQTLAGASAVLYLYSGAADATLTSALTFNYRWMSAAQGSASADVPGDWASASSVTLTHGTYDNYTLEIELEATAMDVANSEDWLTVRIVDPGGATGNVSIHALVEPRYSKVPNATFLA